MNRRALLVVIPLLLLLLLFVVHEWRDANRVIAPLTPPVRVVIRDVHGQVEREGPGSSWVAANAGDVLDSENQLRTGDDGTAVLQIGDRATVRVQPRTRLAVADVADKVSRVNLADGRIGVVVNDGAAIRVVSGTGGVLAESRGPGSFDAMADGQGRLTVATQIGAVHLSSGGKQIDVGAGQQSSAGPGAEPATPAPIPSSLYLKLLPPSGKNDKADAHVLVKTTPGAKVKVNGKLIGIAQGEQMEVPVHLTEGDNRIVVEVEDLAGRTATQELTLTLTSPVEVHTAVTW